MIAAARWAAFEALRRARTGQGIDLASALNSTRGLVPDPRDRALATELALGVERWRAALDATIAAAANRPVEAIDPAALVSLRIALYQLRHLSRVPPHAIVDDAVAMTKRARAERAAGFVNAVLRGLLRGGAGALDAGLPARPAHDADTSAWVTYLSTSLSHPAWLVERLLRRHGAEAAEAWARFDNTAAPLTLRVNTTRIGVEGPGGAIARLAAEGISVEHSRYASAGLTVTDGNPLASSLYREGLIALMDETSQLVGLLAAQVLGGMESDAGDILDACASPGGKTLILACELPADTRLVAGDVRDRRVTLLARTLSRYGLATPVVRHDAAAALPFAALDGVFIDAPCSGLGTIRRDPDIRWRRDEAGLGVYARTQTAMLTAAAKVMAPGGRIVYATCSSEPEENELVVDAFLASHDRFARAPITGATLAPFVDDRGDFRTLPHRDALEAFYAAVVTRVL